MLGHLCQSNHGTTSASVLSLSDVKRKIPGSAETALSQLPGSEQTVVHD